jgi:hypothetical protein
MIGLMIFNVNNSQTGVDHKSNLENDVYVNEPLKVFDVLSLGDSHKILNDI